MVNGPRKIRTRVAVLGASNVRRSLFPLIEQLFRTYARPIEILFACGHGRSYCRPNRVLGWSLPGISESDWTIPWRQEDDAQRIAIVTDIGNDLLYGIAPSMLLDHVACCLDTMRANDRVMLIGLPIERLKEVDRLQFELFRKIFFPGSTLSLNTAIDSAHEVGEGLQQMVLKRHHVWLSPPSTWYGIDPIHIRNRLHKNVWMTILKRLSEVACEGTASVLMSDELSRDPGVDASFRLRRIERARLVFSRAKRQTWMGICRDQAQPSLSFDDGSSVSFF